MNNETFDYPEVLTEDLEAFTLALMLEEQYKKCFLNGFSIWQYINNTMFYRLGRYLGHGICYEASATIMLCLKNYQSSRLVFADCLWDEKTGERTKHAFVEIEFHDTWWVIDPAWSGAAAMPVRREDYYSIFEVKVERRISYEEFWRHEFVQRFYDQMQLPENRYFLQLILFRRVKDTTEMLFEYKPELTDMGPEYIFCIFGKEYPITQRVLREFFARSKRLIPKSRTCRKVKLLIRAIPPV